MNRTTEELSRLLNSQPNSEEQAHLEQIGALIRKRLAKILGNPFETGATSHGEGSEKHDTAI